MGFISCSYSFREHEPALRLHRSRPPFRHLAAYWQRLQPEATRLHFQNQCSQAVGMEGRPWDAAATVAREFPCFAQLPLAFVHLRFDVVAAESHSCRSQRLFRYLKQWMSQLNKVNYRNRHH